VAGRPPLRIGQHGKITRNYLVTVCSWRGAGFVISMVLLGGSNG